MKTPRHGCVEMRDEIPDIQIRSWALDSAIMSNRKGTNPETIIKVAQKYYGFMRPENGQVKEVKVKK